MCYRPGYSVFYIVARQRAGLKRPLRIYVKTIDLYVHVSLATKCVCVYIHKRTCLEHSLSWVQVPPKAAYENDCHRICVLRHLCVSVLSYTQ